MKERLLASRCELTAECESETHLINVSLDGFDPACEEEEDGSLKKERAFFFTHSHCETTELR